MGNIYQKGCYGNKNGTRGTDDNAAAILEAFLTENHNQAKQEYLKLSSEQKTQFIQLWNDNLSEGAFLTDGAMVSIAISELDDQERCN